MRIRVKHTDTGDDILSTVVEGSPDVGDTISVEQEEFPRGIYEVVRKQWCFPNRATAYVVLYVKVVYLTPTPA